MWGHRARLVISRTAHLGCGTKKMRRERRQWPDHNRSLYVLLERTESGFDEGNEKGKAPLKSCLLPNLWKRMP